MNIYVLLFTDRYRDLPPNIYNNVCRDGMTVLQQQHLTEFNIRIPSKSGDIDNRGDPHTAKRTAEHQDHIEYDPKGSTGANSDTPKSPPGRATVRHELKPVQSREVASAVWSWCHKRVSAKPLSRTSLPA